MPCTFSHPAAVLPLRRFCPGLLDFTALVIGSITPDLGYYTHTFAAATFAHTLTGSAVICLPSGIMLYFLFLWAREPVCHILPAPHMQALLPLCRKTPPFLPMRWLSVSISVILGAWTHILWDSFTHPTGWFVQRIAFLREPLPGVETDIRGYYVLQQLSTLAGAGIIAFTYWKWLKNHRVAPRSGSNDGSLYLLWAGLAAIALVFSIPPALKMSGLFTGYTAFRVFIFRTGVYFVSILIPLIVIAAFAIDFRRKRSA